MRTFLLVAILIGATSIHAGDVAVIPFTLIDNRIFVDATINGEGPYPMMFDTGGVYLLHAAVARRLHLEVEATGKISGTGAARVESARTTVRELRIGSIVVRDGRAMVLDDADSPNVFGKFKFAGLIGRELMDRYVIRVDYQRRELTFFPSSYSYKGNGVVLDCDPNINVPVVDGAIDGAPVRLGLDTGARTSIVLYAGFIARHRVRERYHPRFSGITGWGIGGPIRTDLVRIGSVTLAGSTVESPVARLTLMTAGLTSGDRLSALIGPDMLKRFVITFDMPRNRVIVEKSPAFGAAEVYDRSGMWIGEDEHGFEVLDVMPGSPAQAARLAVGDRISAVDGVPVSKLLLPAVRERFRTEPDGARIAFRVGATTKVIVLRDFLGATPAGAR